MKVVRLERVVMNSSIFFQICSLFYISLLLIIYFSKKRLGTVENKIYIILAVTNLIGLILDISSVYTISNMSRYPILNKFVSKAYLVYLLSWMFLFTIYVFIISTNKKNDKNKTELHLSDYKNKVYPATILYFIFLILTIILPLYYKDNGNVIYSYGPSTNLLYFVSGLCIFTWLICLLLNFKQIKQKKYVPIFAFLIIGTLVTIIQGAHPEYLLMTSMETFITFLMYFTIENPDMKLINELNIAKDQAVKANNAKSEFLSSMSHEIRTPLNAIVGFSQALSEEDINDNAKDEVKDIIMASNSLLELVNGILDISKIESGKIEIVNTEYQFKNIYDELVILAKARMGDKPLDFRCHYDEDIPSVLYGDYTRVKQVILNILTNAVKYTREGYIDFSVSSVRKDDICRLIISVEDSGIGIKQENIPKLFTKFERLDLEKNITIEGTGLGLAITKKLVELMNGTIVVQSIYGKGSKFTIAIDQRVVHKEVVVENKEEKKVSEVHAEGRKVLIVDDNKINLKVASRLLENYKLDITTVESGALCIDKVNSDTYDLILMDDMMPNMSGVETLHKLKEIDGFATPVVALTANAVTGMKEKYLNDGFDDYLAKPINRDELNNIVAKYLNK